MLVTRDIQQQKNESTCAVHKKIACEYENKVKLLARKARSLAKICERLKQRSGWFAYHWLQCHEENEQIALSGRRKTMLRALLYQQNSIFA